MPATDDRWDVVVVGLRDPSQAAAMMTIAELAHYASLPPQDVERMLDEGEVPVLENLDRAEAERAAYEIAELGAVVDLRLAMTDSGVFPVFKPDAERQIGVAVGGLIDDSATPPNVGAAVGLPALEPDLETPGAPRPRTITRPPEGRASLGSWASSEASCGLGALDDDLTSHSPGAAPQLEDIRGRDDAAVSGARAGTTRSRAPAPDQSAARGRSPTPAPADSGARARKGTPAPAAGARPGATGRAKPPTAESLLGDIGAGGPAAAPKLPERLQRATAAAAEARSELEVDFAAAGIAAPPKRGRMGTPAPTHVADRSSSNMPRSTRAGHMGGTGASAAGRSHHGSGIFEAIRDDRVATGLMGLCVGLGLSLVLALQLQRSGVRDSLPPLEEELAASLADPADVATGKRRAPAKVEEELDEALGELQRSFLLWWIGPGLLLGLVLARIKAS